MLSEIFIKNFAIIDDLHVSFSNGLTILSGETGAGKSIIINAINLILGSRATSKLIRMNAETAEIEAIFQITPGSAAAKRLEEFGYDSSEDLLIRRVIYKNERHKNYINGRIANMHILEAVTENLASISGQHAHQGLLKEEQQLLILDQFAGLMNLRNEIYNCYNEIVPYIKKLDELKTLKDHQSDQIDFLEFQKSEILKASVTLGEDIKLEHERLRLKNGETLFLAAHGSIDKLYSSKGAIIENLVDIKKTLEKTSVIDSSLLPAVENISSAIYIIEDVVESLKSYEQGIQIDDEKLLIVEDRLDTLKKLKRKYGGSLEEILSYLKTIDEKLSEVENISDKIIDTEKKILALNKNLVKLSEELSAKREKATELIAEKVEEELSSLKMARTKFQVSLRSIPADGKNFSYLSSNGQLITETGIDRATFLIAPNVGEPLKPLANIASGGELSRVILAIKAILAETESVETVVFDEVDAGIGGDVAEMVGRKIASLSKYHQVICITHLAQIAKFGNYHYKIVKHVLEEKTKTIITPLDENDRIQEIARMLGGIKITQATIDHAKEMLEMDS